MHPKIFDFLNEMKTWHPEVFINTKVLECGSMEVSGGSVREVFELPQEYIGVDWQDGPKVDVVSLIHTYRDKPDDYFDVVISTSTLEHDPYWPGSVKRMVELVRKGGSLIITCSGKFGPHCVESSPIDGYYEDRTLDEIMEVINCLSQFEITFTQNEKDVLVFLKGKM